MSLEESLTQTPPYTTAFEGLLAQETGITEQDVFNKSCDIYIAMIAQPRTNEQIISVNLSAQSSGYRNYTHLALVEAARGAFFMKKEVETLFLKLQEEKDALEKEQLEKEVQAVDKTLESE